MIPPTTDDIRLMERLHVKAWPAFETANIGGWLWRYSGGGSQRANSVSTVDFTGDDPDAALDEAEARYRAKGVRSQFHTFNLTRPAGLPDRLRARGYREGEATLTLFKSPEPGVVPADIEQTDAPTPDWRAVYLGAITESRRAVNARILDTIPGPRAFFACRQDGRVISTALSVTGFGAAVVECVATAVEARRQGGAEAVLRALEGWAHAQGVAAIGLQVVATNTPALALYQRLGFVQGAANRFWVRD